MTTTVIPSAVTAGKSLIIEASWVDQKILALIVKHESGERRGVSIDARGQAQLLQALIEHAAEHGDPGAESVTVLDHVGMNGKHLAVLPRTDGEAILLDFRASNGTRLTSMIVQRDALLAALGVEESTTTETATDALPEVERRHGSLIVGDVKVYDSTLDSTIENNLKTEAKTLASAQRHVLAYQAILAERERKREEETRASTERQRGIEVLRRLMYPDTDTRPHVGFEPAVRAYDAGVRAPLTFDDLNA